MADDQKMTDRGVIEVVQNVLLSAGNLGGFLVVAFVSPIGAGNGKPAGNGATEQQKIAAVGNIGARASKKAGGSPRP